MTLILSRADAARAVYIDFECLKTTPPHPALLGVLIGADGEDFEQLVADERLAPARVAKREGLRPVDLPDAAGELVAMARADDRRLIGWSFFDRDRLAAARPDLTDDIARLYVNALQIARPWRRAVYPDVAIEPEDPFAARHTLDKYARLAGYPAAAAIDKAAPATWIRHVLNQMTATGGSYRRTTSETKRDWHRLLEYNRHDCLALRHIVLKAARELESWRAYERTRFCVEDGKREVCFMAGSQSPKLDALLVRHGVARWAFITAWNPASVLLSRAANDSRQAALRRAVAARGYSALEGRGIGADPAWDPEPSLLVLGISRGDAVRLGRTFGQLAIVAGQRGGRSRLVPCPPPVRLK